MSKESAPNQPHLTEKSYLGDGAYAGLTRNRDVVLWTTDGIRVTNEVVLEPEVLQAFREWLAIVRLV